jgi:hypothetical protein
MEDSEMTHSSDQVDQSADSQQQPAQEPYESIHGPGCIERLVQERSADHPQEHGVGEVEALKNKFGSVDDVRLWHAHTHSGGHHPGRECQVAFLLLEVDTLRARNALLEQVAALVLDFHSADTEAFVARHGYGMTTKQLCNRLRAALAQRTTATSQHQEEAKP